jgi:uncharacterized protein (DUF2237 family)
LCNHSFYFLTLDKSMIKNNELNILGTALELCCEDPKTGYFRDGFCRTTQEDSGTHILCAVVTQEFLDYTKSQGNDLSTPMPQWNFPGLKSGSKWCLCIDRWLDAESAGKAPFVVLEATNIKALDYTTLELLRNYELPVI